MDAKTLLEREGFESVANIAVASLFVPVDRLTSSRRLSVCIERIP